MTLDDVPDAAAIQGRLRRGSATALQRTRRGPRQQGRWREATRGALPGTPSAPSSPCRPLNGPGAFNSSARVCTPRMIARFAAMIEPFTHGAVRRDDGPRAHLSRRHRMRPAMPSCSRPRSRRGTSCSSRRRPRTGRRPLPRTTRCRRACASGRPRANRTRTPPRSSTYSRSNVMSALRPVASFSSSAVTGDRPENAWICCAPPCGELGLLHRRVHVFRGGGKRQIAGGVLGVKMRGRDVDLRVPADLGDFAKDRLPVAPPEPGIDDQRARASRRRCRRSGPAGRCRRE